MAMTLATSVVVKITGDSRPFRAAIRGVHSELLGFIPQATLMGARIGDAVIGAAGKAIIAKKANTALSPSRKLVQYEGGRVESEKKNLATARANVRDALYDLQTATSASSKAVAKAALDSARLDALMAGKSLANAKNDLDAAKTAAEAAEKGFAGTARGIGLIASAAAASVGVVLSLVAGLTALAKIGASLGAASHNVEQVFGTSSKAIEDAAQRQANAFGQSKAEYLAYAADIGRSLEKLGVHEDVAADQTIELLDAVQRLAQNKRISFAEAFEQTQTPGALFNENQVQGMARQLGIRNRVLDEGTKALIRNKLAIETINATTDEATSTGNNWNSQLNAIQGNMKNLAGIVGEELEPAFVNFLGKINALLEIAIENWLKYKEVVMGLLGPLGLLGGNEQANAGNPEAVSKRNKAHIDAARKQRLIGQAMGQGGGHGGFQGGLVEFSKRVQGSAFNQRQLGLMQNQLAKAEEIAKATAGTQKAIEALWKRKANEPPPIPW